MPAAKLIDQVLRRDGAARSASSRASMSCGLAIRTRTCGPLRRLGVVERRRDAVLAGELQRALLAAARDDDLVRRPRRPSGSGPRSAPRPSCRRRGTRPVLVRLSSSAVHRPRSVTQVGQRRTTCSRGAPPADASDRDTTRCRTGRRPEPGSPRRASSRLQIPADTVQHLELAPGASRRRRHRRSCGRPRAAADRASRRRSRGRARRASRTAAGSSRPPRACRQYTTSGGSR